MGKFQVVATVRSRLRTASGLVLPPIERECAALFMSCVNAAKKMLELLGNIERSGNVTKSSFTDFQGCSIATMILLIAGILERDVCYEARISFGLTCLRRMAGDHSAAINGVHFMEALKSIADEAAEKLRRLGTDIMPATANSDTMIPAQDSATSVQYCPTALPLQTNIDSMSDPIFADQLEGADSNGWTLGESAYGDPFSLLQFDNEAFLMELTELEMRGVSGS